MNNPFEKTEIKTPFPIEKLNRLPEGFVDTFVNDMKASEVFSVLLILFHERIKKMTPHEIMRNYTENKLFAVSEVDPQIQVKLDAQMYDMLPSDFKAITVSPLTPVGGSSTLSEVDSKTILQTIKSSEVVADTSVTLAMESVKIRRNIGLKNAPVVNLATSQRELRLQAFDNPNFKTHFSSFTITSAGRDTGRYSFEKQKTNEHIKYFLSVFDKLNKEGGYNIKEITVEISDISILELWLKNKRLNREEITKSIRMSTSDKLFDSLGIEFPKKMDSMSGLQLPQELNFLNVPIQVLKKWETLYLSELKQKFPDVKFVFRLDRFAGLGYFSSLCFKIRATNKDGEKIALVDGGSSDWTAKLSADASERFFGSGLGSEILMLKFRE